MGHGKTSFHFAKVVESLAKAVRTDYAAIGELVVPKKISQLTE